MKYGSKRIRRTGGFTIIELMMVVLIIAILAGLVLAIAGIAGKRADVARAVGDMEKIKNALEDFRVDRAEYPDETYANMMTSPTVGVAKYLPNYGISGAIKDPWGRDYQYERPSKMTFRLWSVGPDGANGTGDDVNLTKGQM